MFTKGEYSLNDITYGIMMEHHKNSIEVILVESGTVVSAFKSNSNGSFSFNNMRAKEIGVTIKNSTKKCTSKNNTPIPFQLGAVNQHSFTLSKTDYVVELYRDEIAGIEIKNDKYTLSMQYTDTNLIPNNIPYVALTSTGKDIELADNDLDNIPTRSVEEIALTKDDITWLSKKHYFIVNNDSDAEKLFSFLDNYNGPIAYDTETTGLKINCFGQINSKYQKDLIKYNEEHHDNPIRADKLVGIIFCVEEDTSYYFPCFNRKFENLYQDHNSELRNRLIQNFKARYTVGELKDSDTCFADYWRNTAPEDITSDCILMERVRNILETKHIVAHNGSFEYKVGCQYCIDTNLTDDTMILHQVVYKFRSGTGRAEPSNLKYLSKHELGIDQWELKDFFPNWKEDKEGLVRRKPGSKFNAANQIDFSYMDYQGTKVYAPTDGDCTLGLFHKFKSDMLKNHKEQEYIYNVEVRVACAIGYMEFYGHRIDMSKIMSARAHTMATKAIYESDIRQSINYSDENEIKAYNELKQFLDTEKTTTLNSDQFGDELIKHVETLENAIKANTENIINIGSSSQMCDLFYNKLGYPVQGDKQSVDKKSIKALLKEKDEEGNLRYPMVETYSKYKNEETLLSKFFDNLIYFTYPGGFIFSSYGQIATNTGRMSCRQPNAQQYPKVITKIIIPRDGYVMADADYSQIEYRVLTALAHNDLLMELFKDPDSDYHRLQASLMYEVPYASVTSKMRSDAKGFNFGLAYGMGLKSLAILLSGKATDETIREAKVKRAMYFKNQPNTEKFFNDVKEMAVVNKFTRTIFNRYRYYSFTNEDGTVNNSKKGIALRQAANACIQGSAADIFKIGVARNFSFIRKYKLFGKMLIINMIHDEQLLEIDCNSLNAIKILTCVGENMQFKLDNFPPLYVGAGLGKAWGYAKGKMAEIHPLLLEQLTNENKETPVWRSKEEQINNPIKPEQVLDYMEKRVYNFRKDKIINYMLNKDNWGQPINPEIAGLINLQFNYGRGDEPKNYKGPNGETYNDDEFLALNINDFIKEFNVDAKTEYFLSLADKTKEVEEEEEYSENDEENPDMDMDMEGITYVDYDEASFKLLDDSGKTFGSTIKDIIKTFGVAIIRNKKLIGLNTVDLNYYRKNNVIDYLSQFICDGDDPDALEIVFLKTGGLLENTGVYVKGIDDNKLDRLYRGKQ